MTGIRRWPGVLFAALCCAAAAPAAAQFSVGDFSSWYSIANAAAQNKIEDVQALLLKHRDPDSTDYEGRTALIWAANFDNTAMATLLLDHGAHVDARDSFGDTALHWAAQHGFIDMMQRLIAAQATTDAQNRQGVTPLMQAAANGRVEAARFLLAHGADPKKQDYTGRDAFGWAAGKPSVQQLLAAKPPG